MKSSNLINTTTDLAHSVWQEFWYGFLKRTPNIDFSKIPDRIDFISHYDKESDVHWVEVPELPEFYVTGKTSDELARNFTDTLLVYYDVPTYFAKRFKTGTTLDFLNQKTNKRETVQETVKLNYKEELDRVLA